ncbi:MAG: hypothetical protein IJ060_09255 [Oscillospiraceae bacterium]|nr:hypothetical protein [Oscillospiraceae bacterium]
MKITDRKIEAWCSAYADEHPLTQGFYTAEYLAMLFFKEQKSGDIIRYAESTEPIDEVYFETATAECAARANVPIEELDGTQEENQEAWDRIVQILRKRKKTS